MKLNIFFAYILVLLTLILCACSANEKTISMDELKEQLSKSITLENAVIIELNGNKALSERYGISTSKFDEGFLYTNGENTEKADQIIVIHAVNRASVREIESSLEREVTNILKAWEDVDMAEYKKVKGCVLKAKGRYIMLAIANESKNAEKVFDSFFK